MRDPGLLEAEKECRRAKMFLHAIVLLNRERRIVSEDEKVRPLQFSKTERPTFTIEKLNLEDIRP
jgi:hypothetical protein